MVDKGDTAISKPKLLPIRRVRAREAHAEIRDHAEVSTYLVALVVGDFQCVGGADGVPLRVCATPDKKEGRIALDGGQAILKFYDDYFGIKYPSQSSTWSRCPISARAPWKTPAT